MTIKTLVSNYLKSIGVVAKRSELGLNFTYDGWNFLLWNDKEDTMFFRLTLPGIFDVTDENFAKAIMTCNDINWNYKVVKAVLYEYEDGKEKGASVWMCYEQLLDSQANVGELVPHAVQTLLAASEAYTKEMTEE